MLLFGVSLFLQLMSSSLSHVIVMSSSQFHKQMVNIEVALKLFVLSLLGVNNNFKEISTNFGQFV